MNKAERRRLMDWRLKVLPCSAHTEQPHSHRVSSDEAQRQVGDRPARNVVDFRFG